MRARLTWRAPPTVPMSTLRVVGRTAPVPFITVFATGHLTGEAEKAVTALAPWGRCEGSKSPRQMPKKADFANGRSALPKGNLGFSA